jgi:3-oxoacyl-[acyl-carrier protein] reductase
MAASRRLFLPPELLEVAACCQMQTGPAARDGSRPEGGVREGRHRGLKLGQAADAGDAVESRATTQILYKERLLDENKNLVALVTGASRGVGAATASFLAQRGYDIVVNYHSKRSRAEDVAATVRAFGRRAFVAQADLTRTADVASMMESIRSEFQHINALILNASGGLKKGKSPDYAMQLNFAAQVRVGDFALPLMPNGGRIVFVTSHMAHFYADKGMTGPYEPVAASKYAGEQALRARRTEFANLGISLVVVSGDMIDGTITPRLLEQMDRGMTQSRREQVGALPTVDEFARAIVDAASSPEPAHATIFVGGTPGAALPSSLFRSALLRQLESHDRQEPFVRRAPARA